jgi:septum formation protein
MRELILASTSKYRRELLERLRVPFRCVAPNVDEAVLRASYGPIPAQTLAGRLAEAKAEDVMARFAKAVVIGSDQVCVCQGEILSKPGTAKRAVEQLKMLAGKTHQLFTAICVQHPTETLDCAGSYKLESLGISLFESIESNDHTAITGLPLMLLARILRGYRFRIP